jgi:hypothetical protein
MDQVQLEQPQQSYAYIYRLRLQHEITLANDLSITLNLFLFMLALFYSSAYKDGTGRCLYLFVTASIVTNMVSKWLIQIASSLLYSFDTTLVCSALCWFFSITSQVLAWMAVFQIFQSRRNIQYASYVTGVLLVLCGLAISSDLVYFINSGFNISDQVYLPMLLYVEKVLQFSLVFLFLLLIPSMTSCYTIILYFLLRCIVTLKQENVLFPAIMTSTQQDVNALVDQAQILNTLFFIELPSVLANAITLFCGKNWIEKR